MADQDDARLQYLSWRVWGMKRKHATVQMQREAEQEQDLEDSELSETRSEELTSPVLADAEEIANLVRSGPTPSLPRLTVQPASASAADVDVYDGDDRDNLFSPVAPGSPVAGELVVHTTLTADRVPKLYCVLISMHGLVRGEHMELGKDPDTGGQVGVCAVCALPVGCNCEDQTRQQLPVFCGLPEYTRKHTQVSLWCCCCEHLVLPAWQGHL